jgi:hypothetical protein
MRIPTVRFRGDETPIARWEWFFSPVVTAVFLLLLVLYTPVALFFAFLYPDQHYTHLDWGSPREQVLAERYRRFTRRVGFGRRAVNACTYLFRKQRHRRGAKRKARQA